MAIRKVSDLEGLDFQDETIITESYTKEDFNEDLANTLLEISFPDHSNGFHSYKSMYTTFDSLKTNVIKEILSNDTGEIIFDEIVNFNKHCYFFDGISISGDFFVNWEVPDDEFTNGKWTTGIKNYNNYIVAINNNYLSAKNENIIEAPKTTIGTLNTTLVTFNSSGAKFHCNAVFDEPITVNRGATFNGDVVFNNLIQGTCQRALWADLAECYEFDADYEPGTLVKFGGQKEITIADTEVNAVVTSKPGFLMHSPTVIDKDFHAIALVGRVPVKVVGPIKKFSKIVLSNLPGIAEAQKISTIGNRVLGIALEDKFADEVKLVNCAVQLTF